MKPMVVCAVGALFLVLGNLRADTTSERNAPATPPLGSAGAMEAPSSPIRLGYDPPGPGELGQPLPIRITVSSPLTVTSLVGQVYAVEGAIVSPERFSIPELNSGMAVERTLTVTPYLEGPLRFSVLVQGETGGQVQAGQITVLIPVGDIDREPTQLGTLNTDASGDAIHSLPAGTP